MLFLVVNVKVFQDILVQHVRLQGAVRKKGGSHAEGRKSRKPFVVLVTLQKYCGNPLWCLLSQKYREKCSFFFKMPKGHSRLRHWDVWKFHALKSNTSLVSASVSKAEALDNYTRENNSRCGKFWGSKMKEISGPNPLCKRRPSMTLVHTDMSISERRIWSITCELRKDLLR